MKTSPGEVSRLLQEWRNGDDAATSKLMGLVYTELRRLAARQMRQERPGHILQATALVHEAYIRLLGQRDVAWEGQTHFFGIASRLMREILVEHARKRQALKRGGPEHKMYLEDTVALAAPNQSIDIVALDTVLQRLERLDPQQSRIVELRFFGGLSVEETAVALGISPRTVKRDWSMAKAWLHRAIRTP